MLINCVTKTGSWSRKHIVYIFSITLHVCVLEQLTRERYAISRKYGQLMSNFVENTSHLGEWINRMSP
jgi:hypothetical protein